MTDTFPSHPWMSVRDIAVIEAILTEFLGSAHVLEWGSGASTVHFSPFSKSWQAIEHDEAWAKQVWQHGGNVAFASDPVSYFDPFPQLPRQNYDLIIIDGQRRDICLKMAKGHLSKDGLVLVHDARRGEYRSMMTLWKWLMRVGDDLMLLADREPKKSMLKVLRKFELRGPNTGSYPWHPDHWQGLPADAPIQFSGFQHASKSR